MFNKYDYISIENIITVSIYWAGFKFSRGNNLKSGFFSVSRNQSGEVGTWDLMYSDALKQ